MTLPRVRSLPRSLLAEVQSRREQCDQYENASPPLKPNCENSASHSLYRRSGTFTIMRSLSPSPELFELGRRENPGVDGVANSPFCPSRCIGAATLADAVISTCLQKWIPYCIDPPSLLTAPSFGSSFSRTLASTPPAAGAGKRLHASSPRPSWLNRFTRIGSGRLFARYRSSSC